jgi:hypothetical protein
MFYTFCSTLNFLEIEKMFYTFWFSLQKLKVVKNPRKKYFRNVRLRRLNALFVTVKTEKLRFFSFFHGFKNFPAKNERLKLLAQNLAIINYMQSQ